LVLQVACSLLVHAQCSVQFRSLSRFLMLVSSFQTCWSCVAVLLLLLNSLQQHMKCFHMVRCSVFILSLQTKQRGACLWWTRCLWIPLFCIRFRHQCIARFLQQHMCLRNEVSSAELAQHCIVQIQFNIVSIAASQHVVSMPRPTVFLVLMHNSVLRRFRRPLCL